MFSQTIGKVPNPTNGIRREPDARKTGSKLLRAWLGLLARTDDL